MGRHVIVGAGQVGSLLARTLAEQQHEVTVVTRSGKGPHSVRRVEADASDGEKMAKLAHSADVLYNCVNPAYHRWEEDWPPIANALLGAAKRSGAVYVMLGNLYAYPVPDGPMREDTPLDPPERKGRVRARMWREAKASHEAGHVRATEVRASDYFGPGCLGQSHLGERFVPKLLSGKPAGYIGDPSVPHSWTYVSDVVTALIVAGGDSRAWGRPWHVPTNPPHSVNQMAERLCAIAGVRNPGVKAIPGWILAAMAAVSPAVRELREVRYQFVRPFVIDSRDFQVTFGVSPTPMDEALRETLAWWRGR